jgi:radical SAM protein with 4Fe4S-binding SPASM domain
VAVHLIATIGRHNIEHPVEVVEELVSHRPTSFLLKPVLAEGEAGAAWDAEGVSAEAYAGFMTTVLRHAAEHGSEYLDQTATKFMSRLLGDRNGWRDSCTSRACGSGRSLHVIDPAGASHACPRFVEKAVPAGQTVMVPLGPTRQSAPVVVRPSLADLLPASLRTPPSDCGGCPWLATCGGGCTLISRDPFQPAVPQPDPHCAGYDAVHRELVQRVLPMYLSGAMQRDPLFNGAVTHRLQGTPA